MGLQMKSSVVKRTVLVGNVVSGENNTCHVAAGGDVAILAIFFVVNHVCLLVGLHVVKMCHYVEWSLDLEDETLRQHFTRTAKFFKCLIILNYWRQCQSFWELVLSVSVIHNRLLTEFPCNTPEHVKWKLVDSGVDIGSWHFYQGRINMGKFFLVWLLWLLVTLVCYFTELLFLLL